MLYLVSNKLFLNFISLEVIINAEVEEFKEKMHGMLYGIFKTVESIVEVFNHINDLFPKENKKVVDLKLVRSEKDQDTFQ
ncbi:MAG: hypothetical protein ACYCSW_11260 [bacterium]